MPPKNRRYGRFLAVLVIFGVWRGTLFAVDLLGEGLSVERPGNPYKAADTYPVFPQNTWVDGWFRWDAGWYRRITDHGYYVQPGARQADVAFMPLFPYLARWVGKAIGNPYVAGLIISNVATLFALYFLYLIALELLGDERRSRSALILFLTFPGSFFFSAYYAEGIFILLASAATWAYLKRRFAVAGGVGALATLARPTGVALFAALAADYAWRVATRRERFTWRALGLLLMPTGLGVFMLVLQQQVGDAFAYFRYQAGWGRKSMFPLWTLVDELRRFDWHFPRGSEKNFDLVEILFGVAFLAIAICMAVLRKRRAAPWAWLYVLFVICMNLGTGKSQSMVRHTAVCFPAFIWLADVTEEHPWAQRWLITVFAMLLAIFNLRYANWWWAG